MYPLLRYLNTLIDSAQIQGASGGSDDADEDRRGAPDSRLDLRAAQGHSEAVFKKLMTLKLIEL